MPAPQADGRRQTTSPSRTAVGRTGRPVGYTLHGHGGPVLVLIHGWCCNRGYWDSQIADLSRDATLVTLDLAGHGDTPPPPLDPPPTLADLSEDVVAVVDDLGCDAVVLVGHSMGGPVAMEAAIRLAARCRLVIGADTFTDAAFYGRRAPEEITRRIRPFAADFPGTMARMVHTITLAADPAVTDRIAGDMGRFDPVLGMALLAALLDYDTEARWPHLPCPAETINAALFSARGENLDLPGLRTHLMDRVGHFVMIEEAEAFGTLVRAILRRHGLEA